jgi:hypothetical protein
MFKVAFGEQTVGITQVFELFFNFQSSVPPVKEAEHSRRVSTEKMDENVQRAESISSKNRRVTVCELANMGQFRTF